MILRPVQAQISISVLTVRSVSGTVRESMQSWTPNLIWCHSVRAIISEIYSQNQDKMSCKFILYNKLLSYWAPDGSHFGVYLPVRSLKLKFNKMLQSWCFFLSSLPSFYLQCLYLGVHVNKGTKTLAIICLIFYFWFVVKSWCCLLLLPPAPVVITSPFWILGPSLLSWLVGLCPLCFQDFCSGVIFLLWLLKVDLKFGSNSFVCSPCLGSVTDNLPAATSQVTFCASSCFYLSKFIEDQPKDGN